MSSQPDLKIISHQIEIWTSGIDFEKQFWDNWMSTSGSLWPKNFEAQTNPDAPLAEIIENACSSMDRKRLSVLDFGDGLNRRMRFIGRCGTYQYLDMDQVINQSLASVRRFLEEADRPPC
jgi:hypothetical protein